MHVFTYIYKCIYNMYIYMYIYIYMCVCMCVYVCVCIYIYMYRIYIHLTKHHASKHDKGVSLPDFHGRGERKSSPVALVLLATIAMV